MSSTPDIARHGRHSTRRTSILDGWARTRQFLRGPATLVIAVDIALILLFSIISPGHAFATRRDFTNMGLDAAELVLFAAAVTFLLAAGELDISIGSNVILSSVVGAKVVVAVGGTSLSHYGVYHHLFRGIAAGVAACVLTGVAFGLVNAFLVTWLRINSFITTLATAGIGYGLSLVLTNGSDVPGLPQQLQTSFGVRNVLGGIPLPALVTAIAVVGLWFTLSKTRFGLRTLAIGSSRDAAERAGLRVPSHLVILFVIVGAAAGIGGVIDISRFATTNVGGHQTDALSAIAGTVIGGTSLFGGAGSIVGAVAGAGLAVLLETGLVIQGLTPFYQQIAVGCVLLAAVYIRSRSGAGDHRRTRRHGRAPGRPVDSASKTDNRRR